MCNKEDFNQIKSTFMVKANPTRLFNFARIAAIMQLPSEKLLMTTKLRRHLFIYDNGSLSRETIWRQS